MKRSLILFAMLGFGIVSYGQDCSVKPNAFTSIPVKGIEEVLNTTLVDKDAEPFGYLVRYWRRPILCCCYTNYSVTAVYNTTSSLKLISKLTLGLETEYGNITIRGTQPEDVAYYVDGVRLRAGYIIID